MRTKAKSSESTVDQRAAHDRDKLQCRKREAMHADTHLQNVKSVLESLTKMHPNRLILN